MEYLEGKTIEKAVVEDRKHNGEDAILVSRKLIINIIDNLLSKN